MKIPRPFSFNFINPVLVLILATMTGALLFGSLGCSKHSSNTTGVPTVTDLGLIEVSDGVETQRDLAGGRVCKIDPMVRAEGYMILQMQITESDKLLASPRVQTKSGVPVTFYVGDDKYTLTPKSK